MGFGLFGGIQAGIGIAQAIGGAIQAHRARRDLEALRDPTTQSSASISDYYNRAMQNPFDSLQYKAQQQNIANSVSGGISALQGRHAALAGIGGLIQGQNSALLRAGANAQQQQNSMLGNAVRMKSADDQRVFNINQMMPFQRKVGMLSSKAAGGNQIMNSGLQNTFNGIGTMGMGFGGGGGLGRMFGGGGRQ